MQKVRQVENNKLYQIKKLLLIPWILPKKFNERIDISDNCLENSDAYCIKVHTFWDVKVKRNVP